MHFRLLSVLTTLSSLAVWSNVFCEMVLADTPRQPATDGASTSQSDGQAVYVGPGCDIPANAAYSLRQNQEVTGRGGRTFTIPFEWQEASGHGFCDRAHYITDEEVVDANAGVLLTEVFTPAEWVFHSPALADVAVAVYIPDDDYQRNAILRIPPFIMRREVTYTVRTRPSTSPESESRECFSRTINQGEYQDIFVELGSCQVDGADIISVLLSYEDITGERGGERVVGDIVRFTSNSPQTQR